MPLNSLYVTTPSLHLVRGFMNMQMTPLNHQLGQPESFDQL